MIIIHPLQPDSSYSSLASSPFNAPAPFYIGGGSYTPSEGSNLIGMNEDSSLEVSPPFQIPCVGLLSTSPSTGPGSSMALLRDHLIGTNKITQIGKHRNTIGSSEIISLPDLPDSPFDCFSKDDSQKVDRDSGQGSLLEGAVDTECMFACDENERDEYNDGELDDMPFAWAPADSFSLHKLPVEDQVETLSAIKPRQNTIAQQCLAPPVLTGFEKLTLDGLKVRVFLLLFSDQPIEYRQSIC